MSLYEVRRDLKYPFLTARKLREETTPESVLELTPDEFADFEEVQRRYAEWQEKLGTADGPPA